ncbi:TcfC E-set like domain-containing protein [Cysteiniphilum marinum]|uniref:TcfC E-set like domain-containing protein n=1 Tax=Cysteiniphilum marinum TaxID=2774191 RepID=UPI001781A119|nr:TcfC E-set like domain-containing protein [Cysteiniphilum marinum]
MKRKFITCVIGLSISLAVYAEGNNKANASLIELVPSGFENMLYTSGLVVDLIYQGESIDEYSVQFINADKYIIDLTKLLNQWKVKPSLKAYLITKLGKEGLTLNEVILFPGDNRWLLRSVLDIEALTLTIDINPDALINSGSKESIYFDDGFIKPSVNRFSSIFNYSLNVAQDFSSYTNSNSSLYFGVGNTVSFEQTNITSSFGFSYDDGNGFDAILNQIQIAHDLKSNSVSLGYGGGLLGAGALSRINFGYSGSVIAASLYSNSRLSTSSESDTLHPITLFFPAQSTVRVYKDNKLISVQNFNAGMYDLSTQDFPVGVYNVKIEIYQGSTHVSTVNKLIEKPFVISGLDPTLGFAYAVWGGIASSATGGTYFDRPYLGGSMSKVMNRYMLSNVAAYQAGSLTVLELNNQFKLPWSLFGNLSLGIDNSLGYGLQASLNTSFINGSNIGISYSQYQSELQDSPFAVGYKSGSIGLAANVALGRFGDFSGSINYDFMSDVFYYTLGYNLSLFNRYGLNISGYVNLDWQNSQHLGSIVIDEFNYSFGLNLSYTIDQAGIIGLSSQYTPKSETLANNINYTHNHTTNEFIFDSINIGYMESPDLEMINLGANFSTQLISGSINATASDHLEGVGQSLSATLNGSMVYAQNAGVALSESAGEAGLLFYLDSPEEVKMRLIVNDTTYNVSSGANFISLAPYQSYETYVLQATINGSNYDWDNAKESFALYPGNIYSVVKKIRRVTQVSGQLMRNDQPYAFGKLQSDDRLKTYSDENGYFLLRIDKENPVLNISGDGFSCEISIKDKVNGDAIVNGQWIGEIGC